MNTDQGSNPQKSKGGCLRWGVIGAIILFILLGLMSRCRNDTKHSTSQESIPEKLNQPKLDTIRSGQLSKLFSEKTDKFENVTWIEPKSKPKYQNQNAFYCYFSKESDKVGNFRFVGQYAASDWLFINEVIFNIDGVNYTYLPKKMEHDNKSSIWEWFDDNINKNRLPLIIAISNAKSVGVKWKGKQYSREVEMKQTDIKSIKQTLEYYQSLGGDFY
nr:hypothetical protein [uncultured Chryseobacterium sp.]